MINWNGQIRFPKKNPHNFTVCLVGYILFLVYTLWRLVWPVSVGFVCLFFSHKAEQLNASSNKITQEKNHSDLHSFKFAHFFNMLKTKEIEQVNSSAKNIKTTTVWSEISWENDFSFSKEKITSIQFCFCMCFCDPFNSKLWKSQKKNKIKELFR